MCTRTIRNLLRPKGLFIRGNKHYGDFYTVTKEPKQDDFSIAKDLYQRIKATGPITVSEYMKTVLTNPLGGYYMQKDVFGPKGDFVTSPELGQMFGEMIAVWFLNEWHKVGSPKPLNIVELGPGRGTLCHDMLRVFDHFGALEKETSVHLVEVSHALSDLQARLLCYNANMGPQEGPFFREGITSYGVPVRWYKDYKQVPEGFTFLIAHEFFDALPVHKFVRTSDGYREVLVDIDPKTPEKFRFVKAPGATPACTYIASDERRPHVEASPESCVLVREICTRVQQDGGFALVADYGHLGDGDGDAFRAYRKHEQRDPLDEVGRADLTADVDFGALRSAALDQGGVSVLGPITQRRFLLNMGMRERLDALVQSSSCRSPKSSGGDDQLQQQQRDTLERNFRFMTDDETMGARFKFMALVPKVLEPLLRKVPPAGFTDPTPPSTSTTPPSTSTTPPPTSTTPPTSSTPPLSSSSG